MATLPLFPLGTVLFPGAHLPLRVFEPRYVALLRDVRRTSAPEFGVVAIRRGQETGARRPDVHDVGCVARIESVQPMEGSFSVLASGQRRFRLLRVDEGAASYLVGEVDWLADTPMGDDPVGEAELVERVRVSFAEFAARTGAHVDGVPRDPRRLTASVLDGLGVDVRERQRVLALDHDRVRLREAGRLLQREVGLIDALRCRSAAFSPTTPANPN